MTMNSTTMVAAKTSKAPAVVEMSEIRRKDMRRYGRVIPGELLEDTRATIVPGVSITLHGAVAPGRRLVKNPATGRHEPSTRPVLFCNHFELGDTAEVGSYNLVYMGEIVKITAKQVWVAEYKGTRNERLHKFDIATFASRNWDFDAAEACERNANWMD